MQIDEPIRTESTDMIISSASPKSLKMISLELQDFRTIKVKHIKLIKQVNLHLKCI